MDDHQEQTGDLVDYAEIPGFFGEIVKLRMIIKKKPGILNRSLREALRG